MTKKNLARFPRRRVFFCFASFYTKFVKFSARRRCSPHLVTLMTMSLGSPTIRRRFQFADVYYLPPLTFRRRLLFAGIF